MPTPIAAKRGESLPNKGSRAAESSKRLGQHRDPLRGLKLALRKRRRYSKGSLVDSLSLIGQVVREQKENQPLVGELFGPRAGRSMDARENPTPWSPERQARVVSGP